MNHNKTLFFVIFIISLLGVIACGQASSNNSNDPVQSSRKDMGDENDASDSLLDQGEADVPSDMTIPMEDMSIDIPVDSSEDMSLEDVEVMSSKAESCDSTCEDVNLICVNDYEHFFWGKIAGLALYDDESETPLVTCDAIPNQTSADAGSFVSNVCYCDSL